MLSLGSEARLQGCLCYCLKMEQKEFFLHRSQADGFSLSAAQVSGCLPPTSVPPPPPPPLLPRFPACPPPFLKSCLGRGLPTRHQRSNDRARTLSCQIPDLAPGRLLGQLLYQHGFWYQRKNLGRALDGQLTVVRTPGTRESVPTHSPWSWGTV